MCNERSFYQNISITMLSIGQSIGQSLVKRHHNTISSQHIPSTAREKNVPTNTQIQVKQNQKLQNISL